jgi:peptide/nickel transport system permease protein
MRQYIFRRLIISIITLLGVTMIIYGMIRSMPVDFVALQTAANLNVTEAQREAMREAYGLTDSIPLGYVRWLGSVLQGDLGTSFMFGRPVSEVLIQYMPITATIAALALFFQILIGIPLGILAARRRNTRIDYVITVFVFIGISLPAFFFAAVLKRTFGFHGLDLLPVSGMLNPRIIYDGFTFAKFLDYARHLLMPITVFVITGCGIWLRFTRTNMIEALNADYLRTARAKGVPERVAVYSHGFRNTSVTLITLLGAQLPALFYGAMITESIFAIEGLGNIGLRAAQRADIPYLMGFNLLLAVCTIVGFFIADIMYAVADPRIRLS